MTDRLVSAASRLAGGEVAAGRPGPRRGGGSAVAVGPLRYLLRPQSAEAVIRCRNCGGGAACCDGWTTFCCTLSGHNTCPPYTFIGGWWKCTDYRGSGLCDPRASATTSTATASPAPSCPHGCSCAQRQLPQPLDLLQRFRYGQCNTHVREVTEVVCRVVTCANPCRVYPGQCSCPSSSTTPPAPRLALPERRAGAACLAAVPGPEHRRRRPVTAIVTVETVLLAPAGAAGGRAAAQPRRDPAPARPSCSRGGAATRRARPSRAPDAAGRSTSPGVTPAGDALQVAVTRPAAPTLLAFLTSGCGVCQGFWEAMAPTAGRAAAGVQLVVVTKDPSHEESPSRSCASWPRRRMRVVMSSAAWHGLRRARAPLLRARGRRRERGRRGRRPRVRAGGLAVHATRSRRRRRWRRADRALRAERELAAAGIGPDHPSLYARGSGRRRCRRASFWAWRWRWSPACARRGRHEASRCSGASLRSVSGAGGGDGG